MFISKLKDSGKRLKERRTEIKDALEMVKNNSSPIQDNLINPKTMESYGKYLFIKMQLAPQGVVSAVMGGLSPILFLSLGSL